MDFCRIGLVGLLALASCTPPAYLITDPPFRAAAPEVVAAWNSLSPARDARTLEFAGGAPALEAVLASLGHDVPVLVGASLPPEAKRNLASMRPMTFLGPEVPGVSTLSVRRADAWALVAQQAPTTGGAWVLFPEDVTDSERRAFVEAWGEKGPLVTWVWPGPGGPPPQVSQVFDWVGDRAQPLVAATGAVVHGNPGVANSKGLTWRLGANLGPFLWESVRHSRQEALFLPLETVLASR